MPWFENIDSRLGTGTYGTGKAFTGPSSQAGKEVTGTALDLLSGLASYFGLSTTVDKLIKKSSGAPDYNDVQAAVTKIVTAARAQGEDKLADVESKLANVGLFNKSQAQKTASRKAASKLQQQKQKAQRNLAAGDVALGNAQASINKLSAATAGDYASGDALKTAKAAISSAEQAASYYANPIEQRLDVQKGGHK